MSVTGKHHEASKTEIVTRSISYISSMTCIMALTCPLKIHKT